MIKQKVLPPLILFLTLTTLWQVFSAFELLSPTLLPAPSTVGLTILENKAELFSAFVATLKNSMLGWILSILFGVCFAFVLSLSDLLKRAFLPFAVFFQTVPIIAIAPLLVIYFGFGDPTVIAASFLVSIFPIIANTLMGLDQADLELEELFKLFKASRWQKLLLLKLPSAVPSIYAGLKVSAGLSIIGTVAGEFVAGGGLGAVIDSARTQQRIDLVFAALLLLSLLGAGFIAMIETAYEGLLRWRPLARSGPRT